MKIKRKILGMLVLAGGLALAAGCAVYVPGPEVEGGVVVSSEPPPLQVEVVPVSPGPAYVWIGGFWEWHDHWVWIPGHYAACPRPDAVWVGPVWHHEGHGWVHRPGHWR